MHVYELIEILQTMIKTKEIDELAEVYFGDESDYASLSQITFVTTDDDGDIMLKENE